MALREVKLSYLFEALSTSKEGARPKEGSNQWKLRKSEASRRQCWQCSFYRSRAAEAKAPSVQMIKAV